MSWLSNRQWNDSRKTGFPSSAKSKAETRLIQVFIIDVNVCLFAWCADDLDFYISRAKLAADSLWEPENGIFMIIAMHLRRKW